jgi:hypothetical protein
VIALLLLTFPCGAYAGRGDKSGTAGATELLIPVGARATALAGASLATVSGIEATYWNPAGIIRSSQPVEVMFSHTSYLADIGVEYFALTDILSDDAALGVHVKSLSFGKIPVTTEDFTDGTGEYISPTFIVAGASFARRVSDKISVGIGANYVYEQMGNVSASTIAFTGGVQYVGLGGIDGLAVGVVVRNIGPSLQYTGAGLDRVVQVNDALRSDVTTSIEAAPAELPSTIEIALGYALIADPLGEIHFESSFNNNNFSDDEYKFGIEYAYDHTVFIRGGYSFSSVDVGLEYLFGVSGGVGLKTQLSGIDVSIDYAYRSVKYFSGNHIIDVIFGF